MAKIKVLDQETVNKIAAGEVIERPFSVVKELVENALDAKATRIIVEIKDGGKSAIIVRDNGCGIGKEDATFAFLPHATSKILSLEDLNTIYTLGFRGEALPSISSIAKMKMVSKIATDDIGIEIILEKGQIKQSVPCGCSTGTVMEVNDLFYNTPARRKYLKSSASEVSLISDLLSRLALSRPNVYFKLISQNRVLLETTGNGKLLDTIAAVMGVEVARRMLPLENERAGFKIYGYIGKPELHRATRNHQTFLVNGRYVKSKMISEALRLAYRTRIAPNRHAIAILMLDLPPETLDINVHPAKLEVRFSNEERIRDFIISAIENTLHTPNVVPQVEEKVNKWKNVEKIDQPQSKQLNFKMESGSLNQSLAKKIVPLEKNNPAKPVIQEQKIFESDAINEKADNYTISQNEFPQLLPLSQLLPTFILAQGPEGLYIIDQHAAHERVLYDYYQKKLEEEQSSQILLDPIVLELNTQEIQRLTEHILYFRNLGFILEHFGGDNFLLRGVPVNFPIGEEKNFFFDVLDKQEMHFEDVLAAGLACHSAIRAGQKLGINEMQALIDQMSQLDNPYNCPHGRPTIIKLTFEELIKRFKR